jgi:GNAT superfamily N-acetyltransferase
VRLEMLAGKDGYRDFAEFGTRVYEGNPNYRGTEDGVQELVLMGPTAFHDHARVLPYLVVDGSEPVARFALIHDTRLPDHAQVGFFEARPGLTGLWKLISSEAARRFPEASRIVAGVNGHINYGAAFLMNRFDRPPVFGLPYSHPYYPGYLDSLKAHHLVSYRFTMPEIHQWVESYGSLSRMEGITLRFLDKKQLRRDMEIYTRLNNDSFGGHPFWAHRSASEDYELFHPFRHLMDEENLVFAEHDGQPVAFFLWYPDFNGLVHGPRDLGLRDWVKFRMGRRPDTFRFTQIGIHPDHRRRPLTLAMIRKAISAVARVGYEHCEGGFIFEENRPSMVMVKRILRRAFGRTIEPYRRYAVFEGALK